jgi:hypothetical protein
MAGQCSSRLTVMRPSASARPRPGSPMRCVAGTRQSLSTMSPVVDWPGHRLVARLHLDAGLVQVDEEGRDFALGSGLSEVDAISTA